MCTRIWWKASQSPDVTQSTCRLRRPSEAKTLTSLYQPLVFFQHLLNGYSVLFSGARCRNILQQPPESHAVLLCFCVSLVDHWKLAILNKVSDSFWLFSANKIFVWGDKSLFRLAFRSKYFAAYVANPPSFCVY